MPFGVVHLEAARVGRHTRLPFTRREAGHKARHVNAPTPSNPKIATSPPTRGTSQVETSVPFLRSFDLTVACCHYCLTRLTLCAAWVSTNTPKPGSTLAIPTANKYPSTQ